MKRASLLRKTPLRPVSGRLRARISELKRWAADVKARDGYVCVACHDKEWNASYVEAHHVYPKGKYPDLRTVPENGITLCRLCHKDWHSHSRGWMVWWRSTFPTRDALIRGLLSLPQPGKSTPSSAPATPPAASGRSPRKAGER